MMKNTMQKAILICLTAALSLSAFGCSSKQEEQLPVETISLEQTKQQLTFDFKTGIVNDPAPEQDNAEGNAAEGDVKDSDSDATADSTAAATAAGGISSETVYEDVTQVVNVTDAEGHGVTDAAGEPVTDFTVVETRVLEAPVPAEENTEAGAPDATEETVGAELETTPTAAPQEEPANNYKPAYDTCKAYWLDMSNKGDYVFNGEFLTFSFELKQDIPDGSYPITISKTDIASWEEVRYYPDIINGEIAVNTNLGEQKDMPGDKFALKVNSVEAQQGQTVTVTIDLANNPGFCGFVIDVQYDSNAMTIVKAGGGKDYDQAININS